MSEQQALDEPKVEVRRDPITGSYIVVLVLGGKSHELSRHGDWFVAYDVRVAVEAALRMVLG